MDMVFCLLNLVLEAVLERAHFLVEPLIFILELLKALDSLFVALGLEVTGRLDSSMVLGQRLEVLLGAKEAGLAVGPGLDEGILGFGLR